MATKIVDLTKSGAKSREDLPKNTTVFHIDYEDPDTGMNYGGDFTVKRLTVGEVGRVAIRKAQLNGGLPADTIDSAMGYVNSMLAHLAVAITKAPEWWKPEDFYDTALIQDVYAEVMNFEDSFRDAMARRSRQAQERSEESAGSERSHDTEVVEQEVSTPTNVGDVSSVHDRRAVG